MPTYGYVCSNCGYEFEHFQSITAKPLRRCPRCEKNSLKRLIGTGAGVIFKGSGFYATDYRSKSYREAEKKEKSSGDKKPETKKTESKDSKPDKKDKSTPNEKK